MYRVNRGILTAGSGLKNAVSRMAPAAWYQPGVGITGALTVSNWADQSGNGRDLAQGTAGNQPIYLPYSGTAYGYLPGVNGNTFTTPDSAAVSILGDLTVICKVAADDYTPSAINMIHSTEGAGGNRGYGLYINTDGTLHLYWTADGTNFLNKASTVATGVTDASAKYFKATLDVDNGATGNDVKFYTSDDGSTWVQLGTTVTTAGTTSIFDSTSTLVVGNAPVGSVPFLGKIYSVQLYAGIDAAAVLKADFNPSTFAETSTNGATAVASTGETWTLNSTGAKPAQIVKSASLLFDGTDDYLKTAAFTLNQPVSMYAVWKMVTWTLNDRMIDGEASDSAIVQQTATTPNLRMWTGAYLAEDANLAVGAYGICTMVRNGASSIFQVNQATATTGDSGANNPGGINLGRGANDTGHANIQVKELIAFSAAHTAAQRAVAQNYLAVAHKIAL